MVIEIVKVSLLGCCGRAVRSIEVLSIEGRSRLRISVAGVVSVRVLIRLVVAKMARGCGGVVAGCKSRDGLPVGAGLVGVAGVVLLEVAGSGRLVVVCGVVGDDGVVIVEVGVVAVGRRFAVAGFPVR